MNAPIRGDAAFRFTESGQASLHYLGGPLREPSVDTAQEVHSWWSSDLSTNRVVSIGSGREDLSAVLPWDGSPDSLRRFIAAARRGASLEYFPSLANPSLSFPCVLVEAGRISPDPQFGIMRRFTVPVVLRRIDGGSWQAALEEPLFYYRAGMQVPGLEFTRTGAAPYVDEDGLQSAAENKFRTELLDLDGDDVRETPAGLFGPARTNLIDEDDLTAWSVVNTPGVADSISDPFGGTGAFTITDNDGTNAEFPFRNITFTGDGVKTIAIDVRDRTLPASGGQTIKIRDTTASADVLLATISAYVGGEPTVATSPGSLLGKLYRGNGFWRLFFRTAAVTAANTNRLEIFAATTANQQGAIDVYRPNAFDSALPPYSTLAESVVLGAETWFATFAHLQQPLTVYVRMLEAGSAFATAGNIGVVHIGGDSTGEDPRLSLLYASTATAGCYTLLYDNGIDAAVTATIANGDAVAYGDVVELLGHFDYNEDDDGDIRISQSVDEAAASTAVTAAGPAAGLNLDREWHLNPARIYIGGREGTERGPNPIIAVKILPGIKTMAEARAA